MQRDKQESTSSSIISNTDFEQRPLRRGWTTGACAAAGAKAATEALLGKIFSDPVEVKLPRKLSHTFSITEYTLGHDWVRVSIRKDAGDDPDVTHGALIVTEVRKSTPGSGIVFCAGPGVGIVTKPGLPIAVGAPAISPAPRQYITDAILEVTRQYNTSNDLEVTISIPGGEKLAERTLNGRLGIEGGLSILGTTGVVIPYSCGAWIASIHRGVDVARAAGLPHIAASTGQTSELGVKTLHGLPNTAMIEMGDFAGGLLKYLAKHPVPRVTIAGGFVKLSKLASGHLDLHSSRSKLDLEALILYLLELDADPIFIKEVKKAESGGAVLALAQRENIPLADSVAKEACSKVREILKSEGLRATTILDVVVFDRQGRLIGHANG